MVCGKNEAAGEWVESLQQYQSGLSCRMTHHLHNNLHWSDAMHGYLVWRITCFAATQHVFQGPVENECAIDASYATL